jgi:hypothetical protein
MQSEKKTVRSFDVFDTLVGRLHKDPKSIFYLVEMKYPLPGFFNVRVEAERRSDGTLDDIFRQIIALSGISFQEAEKLRRFEFETELASVFPIACNISQVKDNDILVTDTYYNKEEIQKIVKHVGLTKNVEIFATPGGKSSGSLWPNILSSYNIDMHLGDNPLSDFSSPIKFGIRSKLFGKSEYSLIERALNSAGHGGLANLMRALRLMNPCAVDLLAYQLWDEQSQMNVPILILTSLFLDEFCKAHKKQRILFSARDCCHLIKIFETLFPEYESIYFNSSRHVYRHPSPQYLEYIKSVYSADAVIVDLHGSGKTCTNFFTKYFKFTPCYIPIVGFGHLGFGITRDLGDTIERINYAAEGTLVDYDDQGPVRHPPEYNVEYLQPAYECIKWCVNLLKCYHFGYFDLALLSNLLKILSKRGYVLSRYIKHVGQHMPVPENNSN